MKRYVVAAFLMASAPAWAANQAVLTWTYDMVAWPGATFNVYQGEQGQVKVKTASVSSLTTTVATGLVSAKTYCWHVTAVVGGVESDPSAEACKPFPPSPAALTVK